MDVQVSELIKKAEESLRIAKVIADQKSYGFAVSRGYYAMLYAAEALLLIKGLSFSKHAAVIASFGKEYVKSGVLEAKLHQYLLEAFDLRQVGDYEPLEKINEQTAMKIIANAKIFITEAKKLVNL